MRTLAVACLACVFLFVAESRVQAQNPPLRVKIEHVQVGFRSYAVDDSGGRFKTGLWAPVYVTFAEAADGPILLPTGKDGMGRGTLLVETTDSDDIGNVFPAPLVLSPNDLRAVLTYTKPAVGRPDLRLSVSAGAQTHTLPAMDFAALELGEHLYLTLGARINHLQDALIALAPGKEKEVRETKPREAVYETDVRRLPPEWFGYDAVDLMILPTDNNNFVRDLGTDRTRLKGITDWVRRGGRLVISVAWRNQDTVKALLQAGAWQPPLPDVLAANDTVELKQVFGVHRWGGDRPFPAPGQDPVRLAKLTAGKNVEVILAEANGLPLMVRMPYGLGSVTLLAFDLDKGPFSVWSGRGEFWKALLAKLAPPVAAPVENAQGVIFADQTGAMDVSTALQRELDHFDVAVISFGWIALFILIYILIVGPLDYLILKKVFKRLEWTWITFPTVVLLVSAIAYFTAYALKGNDLKINKVDLIDLDLRSDLDAGQRTRKAYAYGTSWFTILSPRIQNYTVGIGPAGAGAEPSLVSWFGRPETSGMGGMGRQRSQGLFRRAYTYAPEAAGLMGVPIPVWSTKSFTASWETPLAQLPFQAELHYSPTEQNQLAGTIESKLAVPLRDVWLYYGGEWYLLGSQAGQAWKINTHTNHSGRKLDAWVSMQARDVGGDKDYVPSQRYYDPTTTTKNLLFQEKLASPVQDRNHSFRRLDQSWRLYPERWERQPDATREAILFARLPRQTEQAGSRSPIEADLWLGELPGEGKTRPDLPGSLIQDTYLRVYLPVTPGSL
jgi:hypothetical protein